MVNMALRQHLLVFSLLLLVTVGHSYSMKYIMERLNALETKLENENNRRRLEMEALGTKFETENKLRNSETKSLETKFKNENNRTRLEMEALGTTFETENKLRHSETKSLETKFEIENKVRRSETEELFKMMSEMSGGESRINNHEQVTSDENVTLAQLLMITSPSMDKLKTTDLARFVRSLINGFAAEKEENVKLRLELKSISKQMEKEKAKFESRINQIIKNFTNDVFDNQSSLVSVEKCNNFTAFLTETTTANFSEMKEELRQYLGSIQSDVEKSVLELTSNIRVINKTALETARVVRSMIKGVAGEKEENLKLRLELKSTSKHMETEKAKFESRINERIRNLTTDVSDKQTLLTSLEIFNNFAAFLTETTAANFSEIKHELRQSLDSIKSDVEKSVLELSSNVRLVNKTALETTDLARVVRSLVKGVAVEKGENVKLRLELKSISRQMESEKAEFESRINERIRNIANDVFDKQSSLVSVEKFNNFSAFLTEKTSADFSEMKHEFRKSLGSIQSDVEKSVFEITSNIRLVNKTALETTDLARVVRSLINGIAGEKQENAKLRLDLKSISRQLETEKAKFESRINEKIKNFTNFSEIKHELGQSLGSIQSAVEKSVLELTSNILVVNKTALESVERCKNISDLLTVLTSTALYELRNESRQSLISYKSGVEIVLRDGLRTINQTSIKGAERCKNISDSLTELTSEALSEVRNESRQSLISYKSDVEILLRNISDGLRTVKKTSLEGAERCTKRIDAMGVTAAELLSDLRNGPSRSLSSNEILIHQFLISIIPSSCKSLSKRNGMHYLYTETLKNSIAVYCDQQTDGGGWIIFQRRKDGSEDFHRTWNDYKIGFGKLEGEFWLGNDILHALTSAGYNELRIDIEDLKGNKAYAKYSYFKVESEREKYTLKVSGYSGNAGDSLSWHNTNSFSTKDVDNDKSSDSCSVKWKGGWWFRHCHLANLNGYYYHDDNHASWEGIIWDLWKGSNISLKFVEMKIR